MRLEFEYSADDLREAMARAQITVWRRRLVQYSFLGLYCVVAVFYGKIVQRVATSQPASHALVFVILPLIALVLILGISGLYVYLYVAGKVGRPWEAAAKKSSAATSRWRRWLNIGIAVLLIAYGCGMPFLIDRTFADAPDTAAYLDGALLVVSMMAVIALWSQYTNRIRVRSRSVWEMHGWLHGPFRIDIDDQNILISGTQWSSRLRWTAFQGFTETQNLIILYLSTTSFHMLPKRAITSPADLNELSRILVQHVQHGHLFPRPSAFPVNPIPAIPVETAQG